MIHSRLSGNFYVHINRQHEISEALLDPFVYEREEAKYQRRAHTTLSSHFWRHWRWIIKDKYSSWKQNQMFILIKNWKRASIACTAHGWCWWRAWSGRNCPGSWRICIHSGSGSFRCTCNTTLTWIIVMGCSLIATAHSWFTIIAFSRFFTRKLRR